MKKISQSVYCNDEVVFKATVKTIDFLKETAKKSDNKRARLCLHKDREESLHEMIIALSKGTYVRPHKHINKIETFHIIEGHLRLFVFNNKGNVIDSFDMKPPKSGECFLYRAEPDCWHMPAPVSNVVVFHEITNGPFTGKNDSVFADWSPREDEKTKVKEYLKSLMIPNYE